MKKIKLKFRNEFDQFAFYDICWCKGGNFIQCADCRRNPLRYENWAPPKVYAGFWPNGEFLEEAKNGECSMFAPDNGSY